ncbi:hypothetical protein AUP68_00029 [Ilyonectria robusta]
MRTPSYNDGQGAAQSHSLGKPTVTRGTTNIDHKPDSPHEPTNAHKSIDVEEPVNVRMQNPHYVPGTPLFARDPSARLVVQATAGRAHQATFPQSVGTDSIWICNILDRTSYFKLG